MHRPTDEERQLKEEIDEDTVAVGAVVNVTEYLEGVPFPARREDVERYAADHGADESAIEEIRALPPEAEWYNARELVDALRREVEGL